MIYLQVSLPGVPPGQQVEVAGVGGSGSGQREDSDQAIAFATIRPETTIHIQSRRVSIACCFVVINSFLPQFPQLLHAPPPILSRLTPKPGIVGFG